jgi:hypothetical protein
MLVTKHMLSNIGTAKVRWMLGSPLARLTERSIAFYTRQAFEVQYYSIALSLAEDTGLLSMLKKKDDLYYSSLNFDVFNNTYAIVASASVLSPFGSRPKEVSSSCRRGICFSKNTASKPVPLSAIATIHTTFNVSIYVFTT